METWNTTIKLHYADESLSSRTITIKCGIFKGDSLSPLLFCLPLAPLSNLLNNSTYRHKSQKEKLNHLFYMDDLKTFSKDENLLIGLLTIFKTFSDDTKMEFGLDECAKATFKSGRLNKTKDVVPDIDTKVKALDQESTYKYLGVNEADGIQHSAMKEKI